MYRIKLKLSITCPPFGEVSAAADGGEFATLFGTVHPRPPRRTSLQRGIFALIIALMMVAITVEAQYASRGPHLVYGELSETVHRAPSTVNQSSSNELDVLSLDELIELGQTNALSAEAAKADFEMANLNFNIFKSNLKPQLLGMANVPNFSNTFAEVVQNDGTIAFQSVANNNSRVGLQLTQNVAKTGGQLFATSNLQRFDDFNTDKQFYNGSPIRVGFWQPLFGFNQIKWNKKIEPIRLAEAEKQYANNLANISVDAAQLFFNLMTVNEDLKIARSNKESNETLYDIAGEKFKLGKISESALLALQLELVSAKAEEQQATQAVRLASSQVFTFLGKKYDGTLIETELPTVELTSSAAEKHADHYIQTAQTNRPEPITYTRLLTEAERDVAEAKGNGGFQADLTASFGLSRGADNIGDIYGDPQPQQFVELQLSVPILDWGRQKSTVGLAKTRRDFLQKSIAQQRLQFDAEIEQTVSTFNSLQSELELATEMKDLAQKRFDITKNSFALGAISTTDLTLAQREKDRAVRAYVTTLSLYWQSYYLLKSLTGTSN